MNSISDIVYLFLTPVLRIRKEFFNCVHNIAAALIFVIFGLFMARVLSSFVERFLSKIKLDHYTSRIGINEILVRFGFGKSPSYIVGFIVYWTLLAVFFVEAARMLNFDILSVILQRFLVEFVPKIVAAVFIAFGGLLFARFMLGIVQNSAAANNLKGGQALSKIVHFVILIFTTIVAVEQMGIEMKIIRSSFNILFASLGLAFAIAVGLGTKDIARDIIKGMFTENKEEK
ncbi:MAG: hypothetical protein KKH28_02600 [Elusimicrobia bacterium]|nr:hypothetical protein [Elusimicrobiota bacterium]